MQLQGLMIMLFLTIIVPIIIISSNHNVFFLLIALVLLIASLKEIKNIISIFKNRNTDIDNLDEEDIEDEKEVIEDLEDMININIQKFNTGLGLVKGLVIILFFLYCSFFMYGFLLKFLISAIILYRIYLIINLLSKKVNETEDQQYILFHFTKAFYNLLSIVTIIAAVYLKYINVI